MWVEKTCEYKQDSYVMPPSNRHKKMRSLNALGILIKRTKNLFCISIFSISSKNEIYRLDSAAARAAAGASASAFIVKQIEL